MIMSKSQATPALPVCLLQPRVQGSQSESQGPWDQIWESWEDLEKELIVIMMKFGPSSIYIAFTKLHNTIEGHFWEDLISSHDIFFQAKGLNLVRANIDLQFSFLLWFLCLFLPVVFESLTNIKILRMRVTYLLTFLYILPWFSAQNAPPGARAVQTDPSFKSFSCTKHWKSFTGECGSSSSSRRPCFPYYALTGHQNIRW